MKKPSFVDEFNLHQEQKEQFLKSLAAFLVKNVGGKSVSIEVENQRDPNDPRPKLATEWGTLYRDSGIKGYVTEEQALQHLKKLLA